MRRRYGHEANQALRYSKMSCTVSEPELSKSALQQMLNPPVVPQVVPPPRNVPAHWFGVPTAQAAPTQHAPVGAQAVAVQPDVGL